MTEAKFLFAVEFATQPLGVVINAPSTLSPAVLCLFPTAFLGSPFPYSEQEVNLRAVQPDSLKGLDFDSSLPAIPSEQAQC